jgi:hypothetical protein
MRNQWPPIILAWIAVALSWLTIGIAHFHALCH